MNFVDLLIYVDSFPFRKRSPLFSSREIQKSGYQHWLYKISDAVLMFIICQYHDCLSLFFNYSQDLLIPNSQNNMGHPPKFFVFFDPAEFV